MPLISDFFGIAIYMHYNDHNPPHFHAEYSEDEASLEIHTLGILEDYLPRRAHALVLEWAAQHRSELAMNWDRARQGLDLHRIEPLE